MLQGFTHEAFAAGEQLGIVEGIRVDGVAVTGNQLKALVRQLNAKNETRVSLVFQHDGLGVFGAVLTCHFLEFGQDVGKLNQFRTYCGVDG